MLKGALGGTCYENRGLCILKLLALMRAKNKLESQSEGIEQEGVEKKMTKEEI